MAHTGKRKQHKLKAFVQTLCTALVVIILGVSVYTVGVAIKTGSPMPMPFGVGVATVLSGSMEPTMSVDDMVLVKESPTYGIGDIVVYQRGGHLVVHRIISQDGGMIVTQGDANNVSDEPVELSAVMGRVIFRIPKLGAVIMMLKTPLGIGALAGLAVLLLGLSFIKDEKEDPQDAVSVKAETRKKKKEQERLLENQDEGEGHA